MLVIATLAGCKKELEERYNNPEQSSIASIPGFFTALLNSNRVRPSYYEMRTFMLPHAATYSQTASFGYGNTVYQQSDGYTGERWRDFYAATFNNDNKQGTGVNPIYKQIELSYAALPEAEKANNEVFLWAAKVVLYDQAAQMVDMWGDIPFSETSSLVESSTIANGKFDNAKELYTTFISGLKEASDYFKSVNLNTVATSSFNKQDILLKGNLNMWRRYANSIRLRLLMRISFSDEATAKLQIQEMLANSAEYPLIDGGNVGDYNPAISDVLLQPLTDKKNDQLSAMTEIGAYYAPDYLLNKVMLPSNDPRIPVMFDKFGQSNGGIFTPNTEYKAMPITFSGTEQTENYQKYSIVDSSTFLNNSNLPGIVITAPEVNFIKAEAYERWGGGDAQLAYQTAVKQSISFYYYLNSLNSIPKAPLSKPSEETINTFLLNANLAYTGTAQEKLAKIWTQKWVSFGFLQSISAWSEYRRTKYPQLTFVPATLSGYELPPNRLIYPSTETTYNSAYGDVRANDTRTAKIFWDVR